MNKAILKLGRSLSQLGLLWVASTLFLGTSSGLLLPCVAAESPAVFECAKWLAPPPAMESAAPMFRKEFPIEAVPARAVLRVVGLGDFDPIVNGRRLCDTGINQPWSQYERTIFYRDFDIKPHLKAGRNCIAVQLGSSFWHNPNPPSGRYNKDGPQRTAPEPFLLCAEISCTMPDGRVLRIGTDETWRIADGAITFSHIYAGEDYDARRNPGEWSTVEFDDKAWNSPRIAAPPAAQLVPMNWPPIRMHERFVPDSIHEPEPDVFVYSFPQNCSAQLRMKVSGGKPGDEVILRCGEHRNDKNRLFGGYVVGCKLTTNGQTVDYQWRFYYLGMQFVELVGAVPEGHENPRNLPVIRKLELVHVRTAMPQAGTFNCSSDLFNGTSRLIDWAMQSNASWVLTDCPHREKLGWLECSYLLAPSFMYRFDCRDWYAKIIRDVRDAQEPSGRVLTVAPSYPAGRFPGAFDWTVEWGATSVLLPWIHYTWYGDVQILRDNFDMMRRFTDNLQTESKDGLAPAGLGDWYDYGHGQPPGPSRFTPTELSATATWAMCALTVAKAAEVLGQPEVAGSYRAKHAQVAADFQRHFRDAATGRLKHTGSPQCANAMALCAEIVPESDRAALVAEIVADLEKRGWQQTPGDVGHVYLIRALAEAGRSDVLHRVYSRTGVGSYGGILAKGLTSLPETWDATMDGSQSLNHCMLGHVIEWYYGYVAGIRQPPGSAGWKQIIVGPQPGSLESAEATLQTPGGPVSSRWKNKNGVFRLNVSTPAGATATAILPSGKTVKLKGGSETLEEPSRS
jgi:hypothetical protein